jgi:hypothetical protein
MGADNFIAQDFYPEDMALRVAGIQVDAVAQHIMDVAVLYQDLLAALHSDAVGTE